MTSSLGGGSHAEKRMQQTKSWRARKAQMCLRCIEWKDRLTRGTGDSSWRSRRMHFQSSLSVQVKCLKGTAGLIKWWLVQILASHLGKGASGLTLKVRAGWAQTFSSEVNHDSMSPSLAGVWSRSVLQKPACHLSDHQQNEDLLPSRSPQACVWLLLFGCGFSGSLPRSTLSYSQQYLRSFEPELKFGENTFHFL